MARIVIEIKGGSLYGVIGDVPLEVTVLDHDAQEAGTWEADVAPQYVKQNWVGGYDDARRVQQTVWPVPEGHCRGCRHPIPLCACIAVEE